MNHYQSDCGTHWDDDELMVVGNDIGSIGGRGQPFISFANCLPISIYAFEPSQVSFYFKFAPRLNGYRTEEEEEELVLF